MVSDMKDKYTKEEYMELVASSPAYDLINSINFIIVKGFAFNDPTCKSIPEHIKKDYPKVSEIIYDFPLHWIPRFINHENNLIKAIALWRLRIAK